MAGELAVELRQLSYFVVAAEELHLGRAAARMHITQPSFSQQIRRLERRLGVRLLHVTSHHIELTPAGEAFLHEARRTLAQAAEAAEAARRAGRGELGTLTIAFTEGAARRMLPAMLRRVRECYPGITPVLHEMWSAHQLDALRHGQIQVGFVYGPVTDPQLRSRAAHREEFVAVLPQSHPLAARPEVPWREFLDEPLVMFRRELNPGLHDRLSALCRSVGRQLRPCHEIDHAAAIPLLVAAGSGVALVSESRWNQFSGQPGLVSRALTGPTPTAEIRMVWHAGNRTALLANFLRMAPGPGEADAAGPAGG